MTREGAAPRNGPDETRRSALERWHGTRKHVHPCAGAVQAVHVSAVVAAIAMLAANFAERRMGWFGIVIVVVCLYLALKVAGAVAKLAMWALVLVGAYWFLAPYLGLPWPFW